MSSEIEEQPKSSSSLLSDWNSTISSTSAAPSTTPTLNSEIAGMQDSEALLTIQIQFPQIIKAFNATVKRLVEFAETYQDKVDNILKSVEEETEHILGNWQQLLFDDKASSKRDDAMYERAEIVEMKLVEIRRTIKTAIQYINDNQGTGESRSPVNVAPMVLNNHLNSFMLMDQKAEELKSRIQQVASQSQQWWTQGPNSKL